METDKIPIMHAKRAEAEKPSNAADFSTVDLVEKAQNGDRTAFHRLVDQFQPEIYRMIFYRTRSRMDAEDLTQDVMLKAYHHQRQGRDLRQRQGLQEHRALEVLRGFPQLALSHRRQSGKGLLSHEAIPIPVRGRVHGRGGVP